MKLKKIILMILAAAFLLSSSDFNGVTYASTTGTETDNTIGTSTPKAVDNDTKDNGIAFLKAEKEPLVGAPVQKMWTFKASKSGTYKLVFTYSRSWEKDTSNAKTFTYQIKVTKKNGSKSDAIVLNQDKVTTVSKNQNFFITLEENASTGYSWSYQTDKKVIKLVKKETLDKVGAPTQKIWTFQANKSGTYKLVFTYSKSGEKDSSDTKKIEYTVKVTEESTSDTAIEALIEGKENTVKTGQRFSVLLEDNASTGYSWSYEIN